MRSLVKWLVITMLVGFVGAQFLPDVIHVPKRWPPRLPRVEFVREGATTTPLPEPAPVVAAPDTVAPALPPVAAAPSLDAAEAARRARVAEAKPVVRRAKPKRKPEAKALPEEDGSWFSTEPTAMIVPVKITTSVELSGDSERTPVPAAPELKAGEEWPVVCGQVVDARGAGVEGASVTIESTDITEHTDKNGRFCLASPTRKITLLVGADGRNSVRYAAELEGRNTQVSITLEQTQTTIEALL